MSTVAEFARKLHEENPPASSRSLLPVEYPSLSETLGDIRVVLFDVYGTMFNYWRPEFADPQSKQDALLGAFDKTISRFGMHQYLVEMNPEEPPSKTLHDLYHGLIALKHDLALDKNIEFPEVRIETVWEAILLMLKRRKYDTAALGLGTDSDVIKCIAYYYNFVSFNRGLYPGIADALIAFKEKNILLGILSNAQFYTPIDLTLYLRDQSKGLINDYNQYFERDLTYFSYEYGFSKPNTLLYRKLFDTLYELQILPSQTLYVGNDLSIDIKPGAEAGMKTAFFAGDDKSAFFHDCRDRVFPDITFTAYSDLARRVLFHSLPTNQSTEGAL